ncbi:MAG: hypothetical protein BWY22_02411 [Bacteroidetes bacterium ADurb.Bin217]|nr:MAG: hypothetical protein BWY22_02411 [Bacteroidetes bacterium ADurb.Bin217]
MSDQRFDDIRPYHDDEINAAMCRIADNPLLQAVADFLCPGSDIKDLQALFRSIHTSHDFQIKVMHFAINEITRKTSSGVSSNGVTKLDKQTSYLFISNHRDILLDSAIYQVILHENGYKTSEITFGSNLMQPDFVVDIGKSNKMFKVERGLTPREFYTHSKHLSDYIRYTIQHKHESIWIAQRNGRTKDGNDQTDQGILKMFSMSGDSDLIQNFAELHICPLSISYEYEPCIVQKVRELYISKTCKYEKAPGEDLQSILFGITQAKGQIHIEVTKPIELEELQTIANESKTEIYNALLEIIDHRIHKNYKLFPNNYIAYDIAHNTTTYATHYTQQQKEAFMQTMKSQLANIEGNLQELEELYIGIYANPVVNYYK